MKNSFGRTILIVCCIIIGALACNATAYANIPKNKAPTTKEVNGWQKLPDIDFPMWLSIRQDVFQIRSIGELLMLLGDMDDDFTIIVEEQYKEKAEKVLKEIGLIPVEPEKSNKKAK